MSYLEDTVIKLQCTAGAVTHQESYCTYQNMSLLCYCEYAIGQIPSCSEQTKKFHIGEVLYTKVIPNRVREPF